MTSANDQERISALTAGLAATIICWIFAVAYAPDSIEVLGDHSPWLYGLAATAVWAMFSAVTYFLIRRGNRSQDLSSQNENYKCAALRETEVPRGVSLCSCAAEKDRLAAVTVGLALTMSTWVVALSFAPEEWMETLNTAPPWLSCLASAGLWAGFSVASAAVFRASNRRNPLEFN